MRWVRTKLDYIIVLQSYRRNVSLCLICCQLALQYAQPQDWIYMILYGGSLLQVRSLVEQI